MAESYFMQTGAGDLFSVAGIGVVVLITGYLLLDSIRSKLIESSKGAKFYLDQIYQEETQRGNERYTELANLQKATYSATKKNTAMLSEQFEEILLRLETLEINNTKALNKMTELQKKALEGQKNALNLEINYNKENTKQLIKVLREEGKRSDTNELLNKILESLEKNNDLLQTQINDRKSSMYSENFYNQHDKADYIAKEELEDNDTAAGLSMDYITDPNELTVASWSSEPEEKVENLTDTGWSMEAEIEVDRLGTGWDSEVKQEADSFETKGWDIASDAEEDNPLETEQASETNSEIDNIDSIGLNADVNEELDKLISGWDLDTLTEVNAPDISATMGVEPITEALDTTNIDADVNETPESKPEIKPLYEDPNKALTADEIAALFASFGQ